MNRPDTEKTPGFYTRNAEWLLPLGLFVLALAARIAALVQTAGDPYFQTLVIDAKAYHDKALEILGGKWIGHRAFYQDALYPYFLAAIYKVFTPDPFYARAVQAVLGAFSAVFVYYFARLLKNRAAGVAAGLLFLFCGIFLFYDVLVGKESLGVFLTTGFLVLLLLAGLNRRASLWFLAGAALGLAALTRANLLLLAPAYALWILLVRGEPVRKRLVRAVLFAAGVALLISPATVHNYLAEGDFVPVTAQAGQNFYYGNGPKARGMFENPDRVRLVPQYEAGDFRQEALSQTGRSSMPSSEVSRFWFRKGLDEIRRNPGRTARLWMTKAAMFVSSFELPDNYYFAFARTRSSLLAAAAIPFGLLFALGIPGLIALWPDSRRFFLPALFLAGYFASLIPFHMASRYRLPVAPVLAAGSGLFLVWLAEAARQGRWKKILAALVLAGCLAVLSFFPYSFVPGNPEKSFSGPFNSLGASAADKGDFSGAVRLYQKALAANPNFAAAAFNLANALRETEEPREAASWYRRAVKLDPYLADAWLNLGNLYLVNGEPNAAARAIREGLARNPRNAELNMALGLALHFQGDYAGAADAYEKALDLDPDLAAAHYNLACALARGGRLDEARKHLARAIGITPEYGQKARFDPDLAPLYD